MEQFSPTTQPSHLRGAQLGACRARIGDPGEQERKIPSVLVRILGDLDGARLQEDCPKQRWAGKLNDATFQIDINESASLERLRSPWYSDRSRWRKGKHGCPGTQAGRVPDDGVTAEPADQGVGHRVILASLE